jgi:thiol-disulfide isomerase/thioredoxin
MNSSSARGRSGRAVLALAGATLVVSACASDATQSTEYRALAEDRAAVAAELAAANDRIASLEAGLREAETKTASDAERLSAWVEFTGTADAGVWPAALLEAYDLGCSGNSATYAECACFTTSLRDNMSLMDMILINELAFAAQVGLVDFDPATGYPVGMPTEALDALDVAAQECEGLTVTPPPTALEAGRPAVDGEALAPYARSGEDPATGAVAPIVSGADFDGRAVAIEHDGTPRAILFLAHWCSHCRAEVPRVTEWLQQTGGVEGVDLVSVVTATSTDAANYPPSSWLEQEAWPVPVILDDAQGSVHAAYGAGGFPYWVFLDGDGAVVFRSEGELTIAELEGYLRDLAG